MYAWKDGRRQLAITADCVHPFFDAHLKSSMAGQRGDLSFARNPEIQVLN